MWTMFVSRRLAAVSTILLAALLVAAIPAFGQQTYVTRFTAFTGFTNLNSPMLGLKENGFHFQGGVRMNRWLTLGVDYSVASGDMSLTPDLLPTSLRQQMDALKHALSLPSDYVVKVPVHSVTQEFALGPEITYRHFKPITLFIHPDLGLIMENAHPRPAEPVTQFVVQQFKAKGLVPIAGPKRDKVMFWGFGGGMDYNFSKHVSLRFHFDLVRDHMFDDLLQNARNTVRLSIGPVFNLGPNIVKR